MQKKYTILITSNRKGKTNSLSISAAWIKAFTALSFVLGILVVSMFVDYFGLVIQDAENKQLKTANFALNQKFKIVESKLETLEKSLEQVRSFSKKLRLITNIEDNKQLESKELDLSKSAITESVNRSMASTLGFASDAVFLKQPLLDKGLIGQDTVRDYSTLSVRIDRAVKLTKLREVGIIELYDALSEKQNLLNNTPNSLPVRGWYTSIFGYRIHPFTKRPEMHAGIDVAASPGTAVRAPADGVVSYIGYESGYGKIVSIDHGYGLLTRYGHNSQIYVKMGQKVKRHEKISAVGNTGRSTGPHLHYEVRLHGVAVDPKNYILNE